MKSAKKYLFDSLCLLFGVGVIVMLDAVLKKWAYNSLFDKHSGKLDFIKGIIGFHYTENTGAAWSMLSDAPWIFVSVSIIMVIAIAIYYIVSDERNVLMRISLIMVAGGGAGNLVDRLFRTGSKFGNRNGFVVDMLNFEFIDFPVFNLADVFVCIGAGLFILYMLLYGFKDNKSSKVEQNG